MKTALPKTARIAARSALFSAGQWRGESALSSRRKIGTRPLNRERRESQENALRQVARECEGVGVVDYYGHPSRGMAIAFPLPGKSLGDLRELLPRPLSYSCGNALFYLS